MPARRARHQGIAAALLFLFAAPSWAQSVGRSVLSWTLPTQFTDGSAIPAGTPITIRVYRYAQAAGVSTASVVWQGLGTGLDMNSEPLGAHCYFLTATVNNAESAPSATGCKVVRIPGPTDGRIESPTDGRID
jgi:hypothetical protein